MNLSENIGPRIRVTRHQRVILAADLAELYGVPVHRLNEQVRRNSERFLPISPFSSPMRSGFL